MRHLFAGPLAVILSFSAAPWSPTGAAGVPWQTYAAQCEQQAEQDPRVCSLLATCQSWPWLARCVAAHRRATPAARARLDRCIDVTQKQNPRLPASQGGTALGQALRCAGLDQ